MQRLRRREGHSADTTMGLTPLEGLVMGTRSGDVDPNLIDFLARRLDTDLAGRHQHFESRKRPSWSLGPQQ